MPRRTAVRIRRTEKQWTEILRRFEASGLSAREFCRREDLAPRFDLYRFPTNQQALQFGIQRVQTTITMPASRPCPPGFREVQ
jgi:hypothetical protein